MMIKIIRNREKIKRRERKRRRKRERKTITNKNLEETSFY